MDALLIVAIVLTSISINFWQSSRSHKAAERLRASVTPTATVCRDGSWREVPIRQVVPGDVFRLSAGDLVPADGRLLESRDLSVQQSLLTGESLPSDKHATPSNTGPQPTGPNAPSLVFLGTSIVSGFGVAIADATGPQTLFGGIAARLGEHRPETAFEHGLRQFSLLILRTTVVLVLFILLIGIVLKRDALETLLFAVALGVGLTPEFLPMIVSVTLAEGARRMAREQVIVRHLPAIQNFGSIDILCSDKTGTLTSGVMQVHDSVDAFGTESARALTLAAVNSQLETGFRNPLDAAILRRESPSPATWTKVDEIPFDFERRRMSIVAEARDTQGRRLLITKGAPEAVLNVATAVEIDGRQMPIDAAVRVRCADVPARLGHEGRRVLAVAYRWFESGDTFGRADEHGLVLAGFISFADPILPDVAQLLADLKDDGVTVKILTGDQDEVARHVCRQIGLHDVRIVTGDDVDGLDDAALAHVAEETTVFARVAPAQKNRIIAALRRRGHVVGYIGDGINDAPSLRTADIGISVITATDVARDAADVVLGQRSLNVLHQGILEGRRASGNTMKYLLMGTSSNFGNMFSMAIASAFLPFLPMLPTQILLNNFLYDLAQITIPTDNVDREYLTRPRPWDVHVIRDFMIFVGPVSSLFDFITFYVLLHVFRAGEIAFRTGWFVESLATQTLVLFVIRTFGNPLRSRPSAALSCTTMVVVSLGVLLPATPLAERLGFAVPPAGYLAFVAGASSVYLLFVEFIKRLVVRRLGLA